MEILDASDLMFLMYIIYNPYNTHDRWGIQDPFPINMIKFS